VVPVLCEDTVCFYSEIRNADPLFQVAARLLVSTKVVALRAKLWHLAEHYAALNSLTLILCKSMKSFGKKNFLKDGCVL
jgi:predicted benzoate:H+ symporter BenE